MTDLVRRIGPTSRVRVVESSPDDVEREDQVVAEEPLEIRLAWPEAEPQRAWVTMRTPGNDFELAAGWAFHEGLVGVDPWPRSPTAPTRTSPRSRSSTS